jgi:hypothetical protein
MSSTTIGLNTALDQLWAAAEMVKGHVDSISDDERVNDRLVMWSCHGALKAMKNASGLTPSQREKCTNAYRMVSAALGVDES